MKANPERRKFFKKFGIGALSTSVLSSLPLKFFAQTNGAKANLEQKIFVSINPMAVKRTRKI